MGPFKVIMQSVVLFFLFDTILSDYSSQLPPLSVHDQPCHLQSHDTELIIIKTLTPFFCLFFETKEQFYVLCIKF